MAEVPAHCKKGLEMMNANKPLAKVTAEQILTKYENGQSIVDIAAEMGVTNQAIYRHLLTFFGPEWRLYQSARAQADLEKQKEKMESAADGLGVTRARELAGLAKWELERLARHLYGEDKAQINVQGDGIKIELVSYDVSGAQQTQRTIDNKD